MNTCFSWALLIDRLLVGITFVLHGSQKVFGWFGGSGIEGFANFCASLGFPKFLGYAAAFFEFFGGLMIACGVIPEIAAALLIPVMVVALISVHAKNGFFIQNGGYEYALNLLVLLVVIIIAGAGEFAVWDYFKQIRETICIKK